MARIEIGISDADKIRFELAVSNANRTMSEVVRDLVMQWTKQQELLSDKTQHWLVVCLSEKTYDRLLLEEDAKEITTNQIINERLKEYFRQS